MRPVASAAAKVVAMVRVRALALALAAQQAIAQLSQKQLFNPMRRVYALLLLKTAKKNIAQGVPLLGAGSGAGLNHAAARQVLATSRHLYPERFLITKYPEPQAGEQAHVEVIDVLPDELDDADRGIVDRLDELPFDEEGGERFERSP